MTETRIKELIADAAADPDSKSGVRVLGHVVDLVRAGKHRRLDVLLRIVTDNKLPTIDALAVFRALWPVPKAELLNLPGFTAYVRAALVARGDDPDKLTPPVR